MENIEDLAEEEAEKQKTRVTKEEKANAVLLYGDGNMTKQGRQALAPGMRRVVLRCLVYPVYWIWIQQGIEGSDPSCKLASTSSHLPAFIFDLIIQKLDNQCRRHVLLTF